MGDSLVDDTEFLGCSFGKIDDPPLNEGAAVINCNNDALVCFQVDDFDDCAKGEGLMRSTDPIHVVDFSARRLSSMKSWSIPRSYPFLIVRVAYLKEDNQDDQAYTGKSIEKPFFHSFNYKGRKMFFATGANGLYIMQICKRREPIWAIS